MKRIQNRKIVDRGGMVIWKMDRVLFAGAQIVGLSVMMSPLERELGRYGCAIKLRRARQQLAGLLSSIRGDLP